MDEEPFGLDNIPKGELRDTLTEFACTYPDHNVRGVLIAALASSLHTLQQEVTTLKEQLNMRRKEV